MGKKSALSRLIFVARATRWRENTSRSSRHIGTAGITVAETVSGAATGGNGELIRPRGPSGRTAEAMLGVSALGTGTRLKTA